MRGVLSSPLIAVFLLSLTRTGANEVQSNVSTTKCKPHPPSGMPGIPGTNGVPGVPGIPGAPGSPGRDGSKGGKGTVGRRGLQGAIGIPGKIGPRGFEGPAGDMGGKGENGTMVTKGSTGTPGNIGPKGPKGSQGTSGTGTKGTKGSTGTPGNIGPRGPKGSQGTSTIGTKGTKGSTGTPGNIGPRGPNGSQGTSGTGTKGEKGDAANIDPRQRANWKQCAWRRQTGTDSGKIKECSFNKLHSNTALRVSYQGNIRVYSNDACNRWYFKFNSNECSGPLPIDSVIHTESSGFLNILRHHFIEGYCENLPRGTVSVELWVGKCFGYSLPGDASTGWNSVSRIMIEEVPPSQ